MEEPDRHEGRDRAENDTSEDPTQEVAGIEDSADGVGGDSGTPDPDEFRRRLRAKDWHIRELYDELAAARLAADEAAAKVEASGLRLRELEEERARMRERLRALEEEEHGRRRRREGQDRRVVRLEREIERRETEIQRLEHLLEREEEAADTRDRELRRQISRKDAALDTALRRIEGLQRDLQGRENEAAELRITIDELRAEQENPPEPS